MKLLRRRQNARAEQRFQHLMEAGDVPTFPSVVADAIQQVSSPEVDLGEVANTISADPRLTVSLLKLANSPAFAPRSPITSVHQAAVLLGRNQLEALLIASGVAEAMPPQQTVGYSPREFWMEAAWRAAAAAAMAAVVSPSAQYDQFTAALLQDMAQPILLHHDPAYADLLVTHGESHVELADRERELLGWTHPEIGELLCTEWGLPQALSESVSVHHDGPIAGYEIAQWASLIEGPETDTEFLIEQACERFDVSEEVVLRVLDEAGQRAAEIAAVFN